MLNADLIESRIIKILEVQKKVRPKMILEQLEQEHFDLKETHSVIARMIDKNAVLFDKDWNLRINPAIKLVAA